MPVLGAMALPGSSLREPLLSLLRDPWGAVSGAGGAVGDLILSVHLAFCCATIFPPRRKVFLKKHMITSALKVRKDCLQPRASGWCMAKRATSERGGHTRKVCQTLQDGHFQDRHCPFSHYPGGGREENNLRAVSQSNRIPDFMQPLSPSGPG